MGESESQRADYYAPAAPEGESSALRALPTLLRRRAIVILIPLLAVPAVAVQLAVHQKKEYTASSTLLFQSTRHRLASEDDQREAATNVGVLQTGVLSQRAKQKLGGSDGSVAINGSSQSNLINVQATAHSPRRASDLANAVARQYIAFRADAVQNDFQQQEQGVRRQIGKLPAFAFGKAATQQRRSLRQRLRRISLASLAVTSDVRQITIASPPGSPSSPHPVRSGIIGGLVGLLLGLAAALALERLDLRVRDPRFFESVFRRPILGRIPRSRALSKTPPGVLLPPIEGQAFADLRANLRQVAVNGNGRSLVVTSAEAREGKTTVAWHLACAAAGPRHRVLVIEADMRRPGLSAKLGTDGVPGLSEVLEGKVSLDEAIREISIQPRTNGNGNGNGRRRPRTVDVLFAGSATQDPTGLLESQEMEDMLVQVARDYDLVIVDTPPASVASDAVPLITHVGGVIVVGRLAKSKQGAVSELGKRLEQIDAPTLGVVVNSVDVPRDVYHYYYARQRF
jgi:capsular exopolysaccharide synthesis family protein